MRILHCKEQGLEACMATGRGWLRLVASFAVPEGIVISGATQISTGLFIELRLSDFQSMPFK
jgi:hypothetical protein